MLSSRPAAHQFDGPPPAKTPARSLLKSRNALQENVHGHHGGAFTVNAKAGGAGKKTFSQKTPYQPSTLQPQRLFKDSKATATTSTRPLLDKTPFPNRAPPLTHLTPLLDPSQSKLQLRPSSTRKHLRVPRSASRSFETPVTAGNPWDVSDVSIVVDPQNEGGNAVIEEEDYDEIEYMPPSAPIPTYEPPFEVPDYKALGNALSAFAHSYPLDDSPAPPLFYDDDNDELLNASGFTLDKRDMPSLPALDDDSPFSRPKAAATTKMTGGKTAKSVPVRVPLPRVPSIHNQTPSAAATTAPQTRASSAAARTVSSTRASSVLRAPSVASRVTPSTRAPSVAARTTPSVPTGRRAGTVASATARGSASAAKSIARPATSAATTARTTTARSAPRPVTTTATARAGLGGTRAGTSTMSTGRGTVNFNSTRAAPSVSRTTGSVSIARTVPGLSRRNTTSVRDKQAITNDWKASKEEEHAVFGFESQGGLAEVGKGTVEDFMFDV